MNDLIFCTHNENKVKEIRSILNNHFTIASLREVGWHEEIPEPFDTLEENALQKCRVVQQLTGNNCFSEDTGLEVEALDGAPGVKSARYSGEERDFEANIRKLLANLGSSQNRKARFRTVIALILNGKEYLFEGICEGQILTAPIGKQGFGYDPVFVPNGEIKSFAQMTMEEKNHFSHRKKAVEKLTHFLNQYQ